MSAQQKAEFSDVKTLERVAPRPTPKQIATPPEVLAIQAKHKQPAEAAGPSGDHGVTGRDEHDSDDQQRIVGVGPKVIKSKSKK